MVPSRQDDDEPLTAWICSGLSEPTARRTQSGTMPRLVLPPPPLVEEASADAQGWLVDAASIEGRRADPVSIEGRRADPVSIETIGTIEDEPTLEQLPSSVSPSSAPPSSASRTPSSRPPVSYWRSHGARVLLGLSDNPYKKR